MWKPLCQSLPHRHVPFMKKGNYLLIQPNLSYLQENIDAYHQRRRKPVVSEIEKINIIMKTKNSIRYLMYRNR